MHQTADGQPPKVAWLSVTRPEWQSAKGFQDNLRRRSGYTFRIRIVERDKLRACPMPGTLDHRNLMMVRAVHRILDYRGAVSDQTIEEALVAAGMDPLDQEHFYRCRNLYKAMYHSDGDELRGGGLQSVRPVLAPPGTIRDDSFRSQWERRTATALTRLGIRWDYEGEWFQYRDWADHSRRYLPDFRLLDFAHTFIEVKGPSGADAGDLEKMQRVIRLYPRLTILLWDASVIEYVEGVSDPIEIVGLVRTTKLAA